MFAVNGNNYLAICGYLYKENLTNGCFEVVKDIEEIAIVSTICLSTALNKLQICEDETLSAQERYRARKHEVRKLHEQIDRLQKEIARLKWKYEVL